MSHQPVCCPFCEESIHGTIRRTFTFEDLTLRIVMCVVGNDMPTSVYAKGGDGLK